MVAESCDPWRNLRTPLVLAQINSLQIDTVVNRPGIANPLLSRRKKMVMQSALTDWNGEFEKLLSWKDELLNNVEVVEELFASKHEALLAGFFIGERSNSPTEEDEMALIAANVDASVLYQIEELICDFRTRDVAVIPVEHEGTEAVAIGYLGERRKDSETVLGECFIPMLLYLPGEMYSAFEMRVAIAPVSIQRFDRGLGRA